MMTAFERAWALLKAPVEETEVPGLSVAYGTDEEARKTPTIGNVPYAHSNESQMVPMSANEYFDYIASNSGGMFTGMPPLPDRDAEWRWLGRQLGGKENVRRIIEGIKEGMPIGAPELGFDGDEFTGNQEGGHRMEALRQMGHGDTRIPVAVHQREWRHKVKGMPEGRRLPE
tara:strand:+ start:820 stop:1335 length:516 start_codon:yes stop_codon:yes gene_type:complete